MDQPLKKALLLNRGKFMIAKDIKFKNVRSFVDAEINLVKSNLITGWNFDTDDGNGVGKCVKLDSLIATNQGLSELENFLPGDSFITHRHPDSYFWNNSNIKLYNKNCEVEKPSHIYYNGEAKTIKIKILGGMSLEGTPNHPILINTGSEICWKTLQEIQLSLQKKLHWEAIIPLNYFKHQNKSIKLDINNIKTYKICDRNIKLPSILTKDFAYFLGLLKGDGNVSVSGCSITSMDEEILNFIKKFCTSLNITYQLKKQLKSKASIITISSRYWIRFLEKNKLAFVSNLSYFKDIPDLVLKSKKEILLAFLSGLWDADGFVVENGIGICLSSEKMIQKTHKILLSLGVFSFLKTKKSTRYADSHQLIITSTKDLENFKKLKIFRLNRKIIKLNKIIKKRQKRTNYNLHRSAYIDSDYKRKFKEMYAFKNAPLALQKRDLFKLIYTSINHHVRVCNEKIIQFYSICKKHNIYDPYLEYLATTDKIFCPIKEAINSKAMVADFVMPKTNSFIANGFINHNTSIIAALLLLLGGPKLTDINLKKFIRDGEKSATISGSIEVGEDLLEIERVLKAKGSGSLKLAINGVDQDFSTGKLAQEEIFKYIGSPENFKKFRIIDDGSGINILDFTSGQLRKTLMGLCQDKFDTLRKKLLDKKNLYEKYNKNVVLSKHAPSESRLQILQNAIKNLDTTEMNKVIAKIQKFQMEKNKLLTERGKNTQIKDIKTRQIQKLKNMGTCPSCFQEVPEEHKTKLCVPLQKELTEASKKIVGMVNDLKIYEDIVTTEEKKKTKLYGAKQKLNNLKYKLETRISQKEYKFTTKDVEIAKMAIETIDDFANYYVVEWVRVIEPIVNSYIDRLHMHLNFNISEEGNIEVVVTRNEKEFTYDQLSQGEKIFISTIFKIALLMEQQETGLMVSDEAFNSLSGNNLNRILDIISNLPIQLLCISHNPDIDKNLAKEIFIEKREDESTIRKI